MSSTPSTERLEELLIERGERDLNDVESVELEELLREHPSWSAEDLELAAAAAFLALHRDLPLLVGSAGQGRRSMPADVREKVLAGSDATFRGRLPVERADTLKSPPTFSEAGDASPTERPSSNSGVLVRPASDALITRQAEGDSPARRAPQAQEEPDRGASVTNLDAQRALGRTRTLAAVLGLAAGIAATAIAGLTYQMINAPKPQIESLASDALRLPWSVAGDPLVKEIAGEVRWDAKNQRGEMRFTGMPINDPKQHQYQLWIFDAERDERFPIDGGVFDVRNVKGEVVVPIAAKLRVNKPTLFAVTLEPPGGVVVSSREHILVVAKVL